MPDDGIRRTLLRCHNSALGKSNRQKGGITQMTKEQQYYAKWYAANKEKKKAQVKAYREQFKDFIKIKQHQAYLRRKAEGYYA